MMPMPWKPSKRKGTMPSATATDPVARMESMLLTPLKAKPDEPVPPMPWRGKRSRGGGYAALMPTIDEFFGTSNQVCGGFWPFGTDMALPAEGVPVGRSLMTGAGVCCDPISWFKAGIIKQPSMFLLGLPAIGKSTFVRREVLGLSALGMNAIIPGDLKPDYASLVNMLGGQVIRLGAGIGVVNPLDPGDLHHALQQLEGEARKDLTDYYNDTRAALMEVLLTIMRTGRENDTDAGARGVTARESDILSVAVRVLHDRHGGDPQPPVIADLRDLLREGPGEVRTAGDAARAVGISRSAFYKYRDAVRPFNDMKTGRIITFYAMLKNNPGVLSNVLSIFAESGANILTINQSIPTNGCAAVTISAETSEMQESIEEMMATATALEGVVRFDILAA